MTELESTRKFRTPWVSKLRLRQGTERSQEKQQGIE